MFRSIRHVLLLPLLGLAAWYLITKLQIFSPYLLPPPAAVWDAFRDSVADGTLWTHLAISLQRVFLGFFLSAVTAIPLGILCGRSRLFYTYGWFLLEFSGTCAPGRHSAHHPVGRHRRTFETGHHLLGVLFPALPEHPVGNPRL